MGIAPQEIATRRVGEWAVETETDYGRPFVDLMVVATFTRPDGSTVTMPGFYDGRGSNGTHIWRVRFSPDQAGDWQVRIISQPCDAELAYEGSFRVMDRDCRGYLQATPDQGWGFSYESGETAFLMGDTVYNLFGLAHCGGDVDRFMQRRAAQGFNLFRVRCQVSPFHPQNAYSQWQTRSTWPWGGSPQKAQFDRLNLDWFRTMDRVVMQADLLGVGLEMIMEAWGFEFPFSDRGQFTVDWEQLWMRYLLARYDAFGCVYFWTLMNEYEFYPDGDWRYNPLADLWAMRTARWLKALSPHEHIVSVHNGPTMPPFAERFRLDPKAIDAIVYQYWGDQSVTTGWTASGIEGQIAKSLRGWSGSAIYSEWGYERDPSQAITFGAFAGCGPEHNRRAMWRGAFSGLCVMNGFERSWGPVMDLDIDQEGVAYFQHLRRFFTEVVDFAALEPQAALVLEHTSAQELAPLAMTDSDQNTVVCYLPGGDQVTLALAEDRAYAAQWYDPRTGALSPAQSVDGVCECPPCDADTEYPSDWVLLLRA